MTTETDLYAAIIFLMQTWAETGEPTPERVLRKLQAQGLAADATAEDIAALQNKVLIPSTLAARLFDIPPASITYACRTGYIANAVKDARQEWVFKVADMREWREHPPKPGPRPQDEG